MVPSSKVGIISYGAIVPKFRIKTSDIASAHKKDGQQRSLGIVEKAVASVDQDTVTLAVDAARQAVERTKSSKNLKIGAVYVGSESHPYAVKPSAGIVGEALGLDHGYTSADFEFACKAGTAAIQVTCGLAASGMIKQGLAIGADVAQSKAGDPLEYAAAAGAGAFIIGSDKTEQPLIAELLATTSRTYDVPDFWRRSGEESPSHAGRFTGDPSFFRLITETVADLLKQSGTMIDVIDHVVFHMPNAKFARSIAARLGVSKNQLAAGFTVTDIGNPYSACSLVGFAKVLDNAKPNQTIMLCSFGSGAGSDAFLWKTTSAISGYKNGKQFGRTVQDQIDDKEYIDYIQYCRILEKIK